MGRDASQVTLDCAIQTQPNVALIGEEIQVENLLLHDITQRMCDLIEERALDGRNYGVVAFGEMSDKSAYVRRLLRTATSRSHRCPSSSSSCRSASASSRCASGTRRAAPSSAETDIYSATTTAAASLSPDATQHRDHRRGRSARGRRRRERRQRGREDRGRRRWPPTPTPTRARPSGRAWCP